MNNKKQVFALLMALLSLNIANAQVPHFEKTLGGSGDDIGRDVIETDNGYALTGYSNSYGTPSSDVLFMRTSACGDLVCSNVSGGRLPDGGMSIDDISGTPILVVGGSTRSYGSGAVDQYGMQFPNPADCRPFDALATGGDKNDYGNAVSMIGPEGGFGAGATKSFGQGKKDFYITRFGNVNWQVSVGGSNNDEAFDVQKLPDMGCIAIGWTNSFGSGDKDIYVVRLDSAGNIVFAKTYGNQAGGPDVGFAIKPTQDGGFIATGYMTDDVVLGGAFPTKNAFLMKLDSAGNHTWTQMYSDFIFEDVGRDVMQLPGGGYAIVGWGNGQSGGTNYNGSIIITDANGTVINYRSFGGSGDDKLFGFRRTNDGGFIAVGQTNSFKTSNDYDVYLIKTTPSGQTCGNGNLNLFVGEELTVVGNAGVADTGGVSVQGLKDANFMAADSTLCSNCALTSRIATNNTTSISKVDELTWMTYPNPTTSLINVAIALPEQGDVEVQVLDMMGRVVDISKVNGMTTGNISFDLSTQPNGFYMIRLISGDQIRTNKVLLTR